MFRAILFLAAVLAASTASAQRIYNLPAGQYLIVGEVRSVGPVINPDGPVVPPVDPPVVPPVVPPVSEFSRRVVNAVALIPVSDKRHAAAMKLTATYQMLSSQVRDGKIHPTSAVKAAELICPIALAGDAGTWSVVLAMVNEAVGQSGTAADCSGVFTAAADAVLSTVPASGDGDMQAAAERYGFDWNSFLAFLMQLLQILLPLIIS